MMTDEPAVHERVLRETLRLVARTDFDLPPPWVAQQIHRLLRGATGIADPYDQVKRHSNALVLDLFPELKERVEGSADPFATAVRLAIAGNVIDFGCRTRVDDDEIQQAIAGALDASLDEEKLRALRRAIDDAEDILYLADNAGEIVFDRLLIERLPMDRVTLAVRGSPVINDATRVDAEAAGLTSLVTVMDNGADVPGTMPEACSPAFRTRLERCDLVIAKGQGNYETLNNGDPRTFALFLVKCPIVARHVGCAVGEMVICHQPPAGNERQSPDRVSAVEGRGPSPG